VETHLDSEISARGAPTHSGTDFRLYQPMRISKTHSLFKNVTSTDEAVNQFVIACCTSMLSSSVLDFLQTKIISTWQQLSMGDWRMELTPWYPVQRAQTERENINTGDFGKRPKPSACFNCGKVGRRAVDCGLRKRYISSQQLQQ